MNKVVRHMKLLVITCVVFPFVSSWAETAQIKGGSIYILNRSFDIVEEGGISVSTPEDLMISIVESESFLKVTQALDALARSGTIKFFFC